MAWITWTIGTEFKHPGCTVRNDDVNAIASSSYGNHCKDMWMATAQQPIGVLDGVALLRLGSTRQVPQLLSGKPERLACLYRVQDCSTFSPNISEI